MPKPTPTPPSSPASPTALAFPIDDPRQLEEYDNLQFPFGIKAHATGLEFTRDLTKEEWKQFGAGLRNIIRATLWFVGDWIIYGERFAEVTPEQREKDKRDKSRLGHGMAVEIGRITGYSPSFITSIKGVCQRVKPEWRAPELTMHHAREILSAQIPDAQVPFWTHRIKTEGLSTRELRIEIRKSLRTESPSPTTKRPSMFAQEATEFVRKFSAESEGWTEAEWQTYAAWFEPILKAFRGRGL